VNGKRRHRASVIYWIGNGLADGAQGADLSLIPSTRAVAELVGGRALDPETSKNFTVGKVISHRLETNYAVVENVSITIGVSYVLNVEPDNVTETEPDDEDFTVKIVGRSLGEYSPYGFGGAFWYAKCTYNF
jgi:hypothetical protein